MIDELTALVFVLVAFFIGACCGALCVAMLWRESQREDFGVSPIPSTDSYGYPIEK